MILTDHPPPYVPAGYGGAIFRGALLEESGNPTLGPQPLALLDEQPGLAHAAGAGIQPDPDTPRVFTPSRDVLCFLLPTVEGYRTIAFSDDFIKDKRSPDEFMLAQKYRELFSELIIEKFEPRMRKQSFSLDKREIWDAKTAISYGLADELF